MTETPTRTGRPGADAPPEPDGGRADTGWRAWHLHVDSDASSVRDRVVCDVVAPVVADAGAPWFFVRYWQGGPHVRLRVRDLDAEQADRVAAALGARLEEVGALRPGEEPVDAAAHASTVARMVAAGEDPAGPDEALRPAGVHPAAYAPGVERYGGPALMGDAEHLFSLSSQLAVAALRPGPSVGRRAALGLRVAACAAGALPAGRERRAFAELGLEAWRTWVAGLGVPEEEVDRLSSPAAPAVDGASALPSLDTLAGGVPAPFREALEAHVHRARRLTREEPGRLLFSHVHMLHNRLGLSPLDEVQAYARLVPLVRPPAGA